MFAHIVEYQGHVGYPSILVRLNEYIKENLICHFLLAKNVNCMYTVLYNEIGRYFINFSMKCE